MPRKNKQAQALSVSIVIPVYNEEDHIKDCLTSVSKQTVSPFEVIVVDNNCTDDTIKIARSFPFVRVVKQKKQGLIAARNKGFETAKGQILARIDADSILAPNWVETVQRIFRDTTIAAATGYAETRIIPFWKAYGTFWSRVYFISIQAWHNNVVLWGANMALRREVWSSIKKDINLNDRLVHEDQDLSKLIAGKGYQSLLSNDLRIRTHGGSQLYFPKYFNYVIIDHLTHRLHNRLGTLDSPQAKKLAPFERFWKSIVAMIAGLGFAIYSLISWPVLAILFRTNSALAKTFR